MVNISAEFGVPGIRNDFSTLDTSNFYTFALLAFNSWVISSILF